MTNLYPNIMGPGVGVFPGNGSVLVRNATSGTLAAGTHVILDLGTTGTVGDDVTSFVPGHVGTSVGNADSVFGNVIVPTSAAHQRTGQAFVLLESIASGAVGKAAPTGIVPTLVNLRISDLSAGHPLAMGSVSATWGLVPVSAIASNATVGEKIVGYLMQASIGSAGVSSLSTTLGNVWFNGVGAGFGQNAG